MITLETGGERRQGFNGYGDSTIPWSSAGVKFSVEFICIFRWEALDLKLINVYGLSVAKANLIDNTFNTFTIFTDIPIVMFCHLPI